jgi:hypothetical protein
MMLEKNKTSVEKVKEIFDILNFIDTHNLTLGESRNMTYSHVLKGMVSHQKGENDV